MTLFLLALPVCAERYALLIGISDYKYIRDMDGPVNDVGALRELLTDRWSFKEEHVSMLVDDQATKNRIHAELGRLMDRSRPGDHIFIYYSGHGTSRLDVRSDWPLPYTTGALIPVDFQPDGNAEQRLSQLVVGRWRLRPLLESLDRGNRTAFVVIDACFSGNAVRSVSQINPLPTRYVSLLSVRDQDTHLMRGDSVKQFIDSVRSGERNDEPYPYRNVFFLSASGEHEFASDITEKMLSRFPTVDGKPHGAFTDALLRALIGDLHSDTNYDGRLTYSELHRAVRHFMDDRGYAQTPRALPVIDRDTQEFSNKSVFDLETSPIRSRPGRVGSPLLVQITPPLGSLREELSRVQGVKLVDEQPDILVARERGGVVLLTPEGKAIAQLPSKSDELVVQVVKHQLFLKSVTDRLGSRHGFNIKLDLTGSRQAGIAVEGEKISFSLSTERDAYIMLLAIDPLSVVHVIYPMSMSDLKLVRAGEVVQIPAGDAADSAVIQRPFGRERIVAVAFERPPDALRKLIGARIDAFSPYLPALQQLFGERLEEHAYAVLQIETIGQADSVGRTMSDR